MTASQLPAHLQKYQSRDLGTTLSANLGAASPPYISIANGRFNAIDAAGNEMLVGAMDPKLGIYLDACIIDANEHLSRVYYAKDYDPSAQTFSPPDCFSDNGVAPSTSCSAPQSNTCANCEWAVWGSATSAQGKPIPACQQVQKLALVLPQIPQAVFLLRVPPNSHKHLRAYNELCKRNGADPTNLITRIYFDPSTQGTLLFVAVNWIDEAMAQVRELAYTEKKTDTLVGRTDVPRVGALAAPQAPPQIAPPQQPVNHQPNPADIQTQWGVPNQQAPFAMPTATAPVQTAQPAAPMVTGAASATQPASSTEHATTGRRRRRAAPEGQAPANGAAAPQATQQAPQAAQQPAQAPFPVSTVPGSLPGQTDLGFGMAQGQPAAANADVAAQLDSFFGKA